MVGASRAAARPVLKCTEFPSTQILSVQMGMQSGSGQCAEWIAFQSVLHRCVADVTGGPLALSDRGHKGHKAVR
jgi:hypothetical protein